MMENSLIKSGSTEKSKKSRSFDVQNVNKNGGSRNEKNNGKRKRIVDDDVGLEKKQKKEKSSKDEVLSSFELEGKTSKRKLDKNSRGDGVISNNPPHPEGRLGILLSLDSSSNGIRVPKRPRGLRKKSENNHVTSLHSVEQVTEVVEEQVPSGGKSNSTDKIAKSNGGGKSKLVSPVGKPKLGVDGDKKSSSTKICAQVSVPKEEVHFIVNNNGHASSSRKRSSKHRKKKDSESLLVKVEPRVDNSLNVIDDSHEEDEDNLEQNAARMLSSRFDPSCTQFSSKSRSPSRNELSSPTTFDDDFVNGGISMSASSELSSGDRVNRVLRPKKQHKQDGFLGKRRHFYEIFSRDVDAFWIVNRRIKVFWPLDKSWYYGSVCEYSSETKLHHIKYDDRDEEWIDLHKEKFKLLLLPSEVPHKAEPEEFSPSTKNDDGDDKDLPSDDSLESSYLDSEPIISWLTRSSRRVKSSHLGSSKRHRTSYLSPKLSQKLSRAVSRTEHIEKSHSLERDINKLNFNVALPVSFSEPSRVEKSPLGGNSISKDESSPVVYVRRRFRKKDNGLIEPDRKACGSTPVPTMVTFPNCFNPSSENGTPLELTESERLLWVVDNVGLLKLTIPFVEYKKFSLDTDLPVYALNFTFGADSWLIRALFLLKYGTVIIMWPKIHLEILFVDSVVGLRFLLFEGSLKQAVEFVLLVMTVFYRPDQREKSIDMPMPVTSIRFKLSCLEDSRKQHVIAVYSFSQVKLSKWLFLNSKLQQHCLLTEQLPLSECTYDNLRTLETGSNQLPLSSKRRASSANEGLWKEYLHDIIPKGDLVDSSFGAMYRSPSKYSGKREKLLSLALSLGAAPSLSLHLQLLMETNVPSVSLHEDDLRSSLELSEKLRHPLPRGWPLIQEDSTNVSETSPVESSICTHLKPILGAETASECSGYGQVKSLNNHENGKSAAAVASASSKDHKNARDAITQSLETEFVSPQSEQLVTPLQVFPKDEDHVMSVEVSSLQPDERPVVGTPTTATQSSDMASNLSSNIVSPEVTGPRLMWDSGKNSLNSSHVRPGGNPDFIHNVFSSGPKKRRTQVHYTLPSSGLDSSSKHNSHNHRVLPFHRIRKANDNRASEVSRFFYKNKGFLACDANVLITIGEKGWRECGARIELESADCNEWKLAVKLSGTTKYSYKAYQFLHPGSTNRYTLAMIWRGGKDWALEFPDRNQWMLFKEMYEECFNRNLRATSVKNIPIPGVRLVEECDANGTELPFIRSSNYIRQVETDAEMAMDPSHVLYDMDSEDEMWISEYQKLPSAHGSKCEEVTEELFERTMNMFEKVAFVQQRDDFHLDEIEDFMVEIGPIESIKTIHEHWRRKRLSKGMPLIRHLQPPLWESYQLRVKEWEKVVARDNTGRNDKIPCPEKPPMFAFCLKPRGLEMPNKGTKQRSHRRYPVYANNSYSLLGDHDGHYGRRSNGYSNYAEEKVMHLGNSYESLDTSPSFKPSTRVFSPREAGVFGQLSLSNDTYEWNHRHLKLDRNKLKNIGVLRLPNNVEVLGPYNHRTEYKRNGVNRWNRSLPKWPNQRRDQLEVPLRYGFDQLDGSDIDELQLRDASGAAQHALNMAKLKREKAKKLLYKADLATHKAAVAVMTAEAIKASSEDLHNAYDDLDDDESTDYDSCDDDSDDSNDSELE